MQLSILYFCENVSVLVVLGGVRTVEGRKGGQGAPFRVIGGGKCERKVPAWRHWIMRLCLVYESMPVLGGFGAQQ